MINWKFSLDLIFVIDLLFQALNVDHVSKMKMITFAQDIYVPPMRDYKFYFRIAID